jgi:hypothetical protein
LPLLFTACSTKPNVDYGKVTLFSVSGTVKLDGKPLPNASVIFENPDTSFSFGQTDSNGRFSLQFDSIKSGCTPGKKVVRISTKRKAGEEGGDPDGGGDDEGAPRAAPAMDLIPDRYNKKSELTVEVSASKTTFDFELVSK